MTGCFASRAQTAASSEVVVIRFMDGPYRLCDGVLPKALICQGSCSEFEPCISALRRVFAETQATGAQCCSPDPVNTSFWEQDRSGVADVPGRPSPRRNGQHDDTQREHRQSYEFEHQSVSHSNSPNKPIDLSGND